jgi:two-component system response regulator YesN
MYKLIYADDEAIMRDNISRMINWRDQGFDLAAICSNGHDLVEVAEREQPDVVILDINMPYIDGIAAAKRIREEVPQAKLAFLTGYDNFSYAQKAIDLNVIKYILKPITATTLAAILAEIRCLLDDERRARADDRRLQAFYDQNRILFKDAFINMLLEGTPMKNEVAVRTAATEFGIIPEGPYISAVIMNDSTEEGSVYESGSAANLLNSGIYSIAAEEVERQGLGAAALKGDRTVVVICCQPGSGKPLLSIVAACLEQIRRTVQDTLKITVTIGVGNEYIGYDGISCSYNEADSALAYRRMLGKNRLIFISDVESNRQPVKSFDHYYEMLLIKAIKTGDIQQIDDLIGYLLLSDWAGDINGQCVFALSMMVSVAQEAVRLGFSADSCLSGSMIETVFRRISADGLCDDVRETCLRLSRLVGSQQQTSQRGIFEKTVRFLEEHMSETDLSVEDVCGELHYSLSYFRSLFKKEAGLSFGAFLTRMRMEKAKQYLLDTELKSYLIARQVGFSDPHYFSFCFKKYFGVSPKEIREANRVSCV